MKVKMSLKGTWFNLMQRFKHRATDAGWTKEQITEVIKELSQTSTGESLKDVLRKYTYQD